MKYGETLQRRSIVAWRAHNIDYDEIKRFIKQRTTPGGKGESISVPGRGDDKLAAFDSELSQIFTEQHERINLFVRSKVGEIKRRLEHAKRQLQQLSSRRASSMADAADRRIPIARLERYSRLENDVVKIGDEVRSLARFTNTNRTAFRKLIKKARKWSRSERLCEAFRAKELLGGESFLDLDFAPLLEDYSATLANIRGLYESRIKPTSAKADSDLDPTAGTSITQRLLAATKTGSKVDFDTAIAIVPLGESGDIANYFVHPEYAVELQVLLLNHVQPYAARSRHNSLARSSSGNLTNGTSSGGSSPNDQDYFMLVADNVDRFAKVEGAMTVNEREHVAGVIPQRAKHFLRWTSDEDAALASRLGPAKIRTASLKRKHADTFFDVGSSQRRESDATLADRSLAAVRDEISKDRTIQPLYKISSRRGRFIGFSDGSESFTLATLDSHITITKGEQTASEASTSNFPFAVLQVRTEGDGLCELIKTLDESHLVERVRGFSLQYHALWQTCKPDNMSHPFWMDILSRDIRKLPPPSHTRKDSLAPRGSASDLGSAKQQSTGTNSVRCLTDETTAVDTPPHSSGAAPPDQLETPPLKSFRKKRRRKYPDHQPNETPTSKSEQRYWNEYDNPENGEGGEDAYVILIDPNERSVWDKLFDSIWSLFSPKQQQREPDAEPSDSTTARDEESSSDEDESTALNPQRQQYLRSYGTSSHLHPSHQHRDPELTPSIPQTTTICLSASLAILAVTFILAATSKHKYVRAVDAAIVFAILCSLVFAGVGFVALMGQRRGPGAREGRGVGWGVMGLAAAVVLVDAVGCGGLLAWMLGL